MVQITSNANSRRTPLIGSRIAVAPGVVTRHRSFLPCEGLLPGGCNCMRTRRSISARHRPFGREYCSRLPRSGRAFPSKGLNPGSRSRPGSRRRCLVESPLAKRTRRRQVRGRQSPGKPGDLLGRKLECRCCQVVCRAHCSLHSIIFGTLHRKQTSIDKDRSDGAEQPSGATGAKAPTHSGGQTVS